jgi:hypothetical protein
MTAIMDHDPAWRQIIHCTLMNVKGQTVKITIEHNSVVPPCYIMLGKRLFHDQGNWKLGERHAPIEASYVEISPGRVVDASDQTPTIMEKAA